MNKVLFRRLVGNGERWTDSSRAMISDMLEVWDMGHYIVIYELNSQQLVGNNNEYLTVDWQDLILDIDKNKIVGCVSVCNDAMPIFNHVKNILHKNNDCNNSQKYLIVIEEDGLGGQLVRGIIARKNENLFFAESPLYEDYKPVTTWDKKERLNTTKIKLIGSYIDASMQRQN